MAKHDNVTGPILGVFPSTQQHWRRMRFLPFLRENARWLAAGVVLTCSSSFGQTFFISLSAANLQETFGLSHGSWGGIYTLGTLMSAALLMQVGRLADRFRVRSLALLTIAAFVVMCLAMATVSHWAMLVLIVFGLRFCGQGMMSHLALTAMGRWFSSNRGRAVAIASLGFSIGEGFLPVCFVVLTGMIGWRMGWVVAAGILAVVIVPLLVWLLSTERSPQTMSDAQHTAGIGGRHWTRSEAMRHWLLWTLMPGFLAPSFLITSLFFHQVHLTGIKGWPIAAYVATFPIYSGCAMLANFAAGALSDKFGSARLLPFYLLPISAAMTIMAVAQNFWLGPVALVLSGVTQGASQAILGSLWPEFFGTRNLGSIRAFTVAAMVLSSAVGPGVTGWLIDVGINFETQCLWMGGYAALISLFFVTVARAAQQERYPQGKDKT